MAIVAMSLAEVDASKAIAAQHIGAVSDGLQVRWSHARSRPAEMVKGQPFWDWSNQQFPRKAMSEDDASFAPTDTESPISPIERGFPQPTLTRLVHLRPETVGDGLEWLMADSRPRTSPVLITKTSGDGPVT